MSYTLWSVLIFTDYDLCPCHIEDCPEFYCTAYCYLLTTCSAVVTFFFAVLWSVMSDSVTSTDCSLPGSLYHFISYLGRSNFSLSWILLWYTYLCKLPFLSFNIPWNLFPQTVLLVIRSGQKNEWIHTYTYCPAVLQKDDNKLLVSIWQQFFRQEFLKSYFKKVEILEFKDWNGGLFRGHLSQLPQECKDALPPFHNSSRQNIFVRSYVVKYKRKIQPHKNMQL